MPRSMPIFMRWWKRSLLRGARSWRRGPGTCARCSHTPAGRGAHRESSTSPSAASAARISEAPARRSPISTSAPWSGVRPVDRGVLRVDDVDPSAPIRRSSASHSRRSSKIASWTVEVPVGLGQQDARSAAGGRWRGPGYGRGLDVDRPGSRRRASARAVDLDRVARRSRRATPARPRTSRNAVEVVARGARRA